MSKKRNRNRQNANDSAIKEQNSSAAAQQNSQNIMMQIKKGEGQQIFPEEQLAYQDNKPE